MKLVEEEFEFCYLFELQFETVKMQRETAMVLLGGDVMVVFHGGLGFEFEFHGGIWVSPWLDSIEHGGWKEVFNWEWRIENGGKGFLIENCERLRMEERVSREEWRGKRESGMSFTGFTKEREWKVNFFLEGHFGLALWILINSFLNGVKQFEVQNFPYT